MRMFRNAADCLNVAAELNKAGVRLYLHDLGGWIAGTPEAEFRLTIFAGVAQFERKRCQQRIRESQGISSQPSAASRAANRRLDIVRWGVQRANARDRTHL